MARHRQAICGCRATHGWLGSTVGPEHIAISLSHSGPELLLLFHPRSSNSPLSDPSACNVLGLVPDRGRVTDQLNFVHFAGAG